MLFSVNKKPEAHRALRGTSHGGGCSSVSVDKPADQRTEGVMTSCLHADVQCTYSVYINMSM